MSGAFRFDRKKGQWNDMLFVSESLTNRQKLKRGCEKTMQVQEKFFFFFSIFNFFFYINIM